MATKAFDLFAALRLEGKDRVAADLKDVEKRSVQAATAIEQHFGQRVARGLGQASQALEGFGGRAGSVAGLLAGRVALVSSAFTGLGLALASATRAAISFEREFAKSRVFLTGTPQQIAAIEKSLHGLDSRLGATVELLPTFRKALLDSADPKAALRMTELAAAFAKVSGATPEQAVEVLGSLMDSFGIRAEHASRITDGLFQIMRSGGGDISELAARFPLLADAGKELGVTFEELGAALNTLGSVAGASPQKNIQALILLLQGVARNQEKFLDRGVDVRALTQQYGGLVGILKALERAATDANGQLSAVRLGELGVEGRSLFAIQKLIGAVGELDAHVKKFGAEAPGSVARAFKEIGATASEEITRIGTEFSKLQDTLSKGLEVPVKFLAGTAADILRGLRAALGEPQPELTGQARRINQQQGPVNLTGIPSVRILGPGETGGPPPLPPAVLAAQRERALAGRIGDFELRARQARRENDIDRATAETVGGLVARIQGVRAEAARIGKSTEGTREERGVQTQKLLQEEETLQRQIIDVIRDAEEEKTRARARAAADAIRIQQEATRSIIEHIRQEEEAAEHRFNVDVTLGRLSVQAQIQRNREIAEDTKRTERERLDAKVKVYEAEKKLAEDAAETAKKSAEDARNAFQQALGIGTSETVSRDSLTRDVSKRRARDRNLFERFNVGGRVNRQDLLSAVGRQPFFEQLSANDRAGTVPLTDLQRRALAVGDVGMAQDFARQDLRALGIQPPLRLGLSPDEHRRTMQDYFGPQRPPARYDILGPPIPGGGGVNDPGGGVHPFRPGASLGISPDDIAASIEAVSSGLGRLEQIVASYKTRISRSLADQVSDFIADDLETVRG